MGEKITKLRKEIDRIDQSLLKLLGKRMAVAGKIGQIKKQSKLSMVDKKRWQIVLDKNLEQGEKLGLPASFVKRIYQLIHQTSVKVQKEPR